MKLLVKICMAVMMVSPLHLLAQKTDQAKKEDQLALRCPLKSPGGKEPKEAFLWNPPDKKVTMVSNIDSLVTSTFNGKVSNISVTEDNLYEIVIYYKEFYMWYFGIAKPLVKINQEVKSGEKIGTYLPGTELEFRLFKDEEAIDPREMLECRIAKSQ
jgi:hypothetical protein